MSLKRLVFIALICLSVLPLKAQLGLSFSINKHVDSWALFSGYTGLELQIIDTLYFDKENHLSYEFTLPQGMYQLEVDGETLEFLSEGKPVQYVATASLTEGEWFDDANRQWSAYLHERTSYRQEIEALKTVLRQYDPQSPFYQNASQEFVRRQQSFHEVTEQLISDAPDSFAARLIKADREMAIDPKSSGAEQRQMLIDHFLDEVDFNDLSLIPTNVLTTKMIDYLSLFQGFEGVNDPNVAFAIGLGKILEKAKVNTKMYGFVLEYMLKGFTALGMDAVTDYLLNYPQLGEGDITVEDGMMLDSISAPYQKVRVGVKAPDISGLTINGDPYRLYDSQAKRKIVFFWSTECEYCHDFLTAIRKNLDLENDYELVTIALAESKKEVEKAVKKMKLLGHHFYEEERWEGEIIKNYHVFSTPTVFVLDADNNIVLKPYDWTEFCRDAIHRVCD